VEPGYPEEWRVRLGRITAQRRRLDEESRLLVAQALGAGASWSCIASALGVARQTAWQRYRHLVPTHPTNTDA